MLSYHIDKKIIQKERTEKNIFLDENEPNFFEGLLIELCELEIVKEPGYLGSSNSSLADVNNISKPYDFPYRQTRAMIK